MDTYSYKQPLGVCAGICPFNFPAMIPLWMFPLAAACGPCVYLSSIHTCFGAILGGVLRLSTYATCPVVPTPNQRTTIHHQPPNPKKTGNTFVLKPSERDPGAALLLAEMAKEAGLPDGVLNLVHGGVPTVDFLCDAPEVKVSGCGEWVVHIRRHARPHTRSHTHTHLQTPNPYHHIYTLTHTHTHTHTHIYI